MGKAIAISLIMFLFAPVYAQNEEVMFKNIASEISSLRGKIQNSTIAVFPFETPGAPSSAYGRYAADKISSELIRQGKLKLVEREKLNNIMREKELSMLGVAEHDEARKIGKILSIDAVVVGTVYRTETGRSLSVRVIDTRSGEILALISRNYSDSSEIQGEKRKYWYTGEWKVVSTAPFLKKNSMNYEKLVLDSDGAFRLHLVNNDNRNVEIRGKFRVEKNEINYTPHQMYIDGKVSSFKKLSTHLEGTIYLVEGKLYFNYTSMGMPERMRLDAMNPEYRCVAELIE